MFMKLIFFVLDPALCGSQGIGRRGLDFLAHQPMLISIPSWTYLKYYNETQVGVGLCMDVPALISSYG